ncbi:hypothetical protein K439DRAFT_1357639 [Ramaria rubella]|nr:hypothetical protein K439DRAFT_1357639 [Ramaria rubella]
MPKASKSSATSGTRKKHARKAAEPGSIIIPQNVKSKPSKKEIKKGLAPPPKKSYIPPSKLKPAPLQADPLDSLGSLLPADLIVILRRLAKKDGVTKSRALEELEGWIRRAKEDNDSNIGYDNIQFLVLMLPVWLHRYPGLCVHQSRRIRQLSASLHALLLDIPAVRSGMISFLQDTGPETQVSHILGSWCLSAWDIDRGVAARGLKSWKDALSVRIGDAPSDPASTLADSSVQFILDESILSRYILPFITTTIMDPASTFATLNPSSFLTSGESPGSSHYGTPRRGSSTPTGNPSGLSVRRALFGEDLTRLTTRAEDDPESVEDKNARLRVGAMGALRWVFDTCVPTATIVTSLHPLISSPTFWTILHYAAHPPFQAEEASLPDTSEGFGTKQTIVRRAGWGIVHALVGSHRSSIRDESWGGWVNQSEQNEQASNFPSALGLISSAILRSAFVEPDPVVRSSMWEPLLMFLTKINNAWVLNRGYEHPASFVKAQAEDESDSSSESSKSVNETGLELSHPHPQSEEETPNFAAYAEFLSFLGLGCNGSPIQGYPTILVILSTIPNEILFPSLTALSGFFDALWSAIDGQAVGALSSDRARGSEAFLSAWGECLVWTAGKLVKGSELFHPTEDSEQRNSASNAFTGDMSPKEVSRALVNAQFDKLVGELGSTFRISANAAGIKIATVLEKMETLGPDLLDEPWKHISKYARSTIANSIDESLGKFALSFLVSLYEHLQSDVSKCAVEKLLLDIAEEVVRRCQGEASQKEGQETNSNESELLEYGRVLEVLLEQFGTTLGREEGFVQLLDNLITTKLPSLISRPSLILSYLKHIEDVAHRLTIWHLLLDTLGSSSAFELNKKVEVLDYFLDAVNKDSLEMWAKPQGQELQGLAGDVLADALNGDTASLNLIVKLLQMPGPFIHITTVQSLLASVVITLGSHLEPLFRQDEPVSVRALGGPLKLLLTFERNAPISELSNLSDIMPQVFTLAFVMPHSFSLEEEIQDVARQLWETWRDRTEIQPRKAVTVEVKRLLKALLLDINARPRPTAILRALPHVALETSAQAVIDIIPTVTEFGVLLSSTSVDPIDTSLAIIEPLAPTFVTRTNAKRSLWNTKFDSSGFSPYARAVSAWLHVLTADRHLARENMWALQHALTLALFASEILQVPEAQSPVFDGQRIADSELREITRLTQQTAAFLLASTGEGSWHKDVVDVLSGKGHPDGLDSVGQFVQAVFEQSKLHDTVRDSLVLHTVLQHVLRNATKEDADRWIDLARGVEAPALQTSLAVSLAVTEFAPEPLKLDRYRNELASKITGVSSSKVNTSGLRLLRCLSAVAPNPETDIIFLPQQRAVYLVQTLQAWIGSDDDLNESVENEITLILFNLAPILQNVQGAHWEFIMDLMESNIENASFEDADSLVILFRTLNLMMSIRELASSNKYLKELWNQRSKAILVLVRDLLTAKPDRTSLSIPRALCREQALSIVQGLPESLMDEDTLSNMCHLLIYPSVDNQKMAYQILQQAAAKRTEHLVLEAGVDSENTAIFDLPRELILLLTSVLNFDDANGQDPLTYFLGWMLTFDLFADASLKVKTAYVDQLRSLDLIGSYFLPSIFETLGVGSNRSPFKLDPWVVDEYWLPLYDANAPQSLQLLAAHVYYRALLTVPSLIRTWWEDLKDRQLSTAITAFTSSYFSPVLIASELVHVKPSHAEEEEEPLMDESFNVKVALAINEVTATFNVDDQQMEIAVKLPVGYPLKTVEVRPIRRVGVPEKVWRKWLFAVQQVVTSHNGRIVDGLALFKRTASLHFEGQVECAICYSILHVVDRSLPTKPCKTCKNRFHAGCLYKWFNTSHASSCPLCRSDIM